MKEMIGRTHPISPSIFLSIISHGVLIFLLMSFWEITFPLGSDSKSNVISVSLIGKGTEKTPTFFDSENLIRPIEKSGKPISGDSNTSIDSFSLSYQRDKNIQSKKQATIEADFLPLREGSEVANHPKKEELLGIGLEIEEPLVPMENDGMETPKEVYKKMEPNLKLDREVNQGTFISQEISLWSNSSQKNVEVFTSLEDGTTLGDFLPTSLSFENKLVAVEGDPGEEGSESNQWGKDSEWVSYQMELFRLIEKGKRYPFFAKMRNISGVVVIGFTIGAEGRASNIEVIRSSDQKILDREALDTIRRVSPFPPFPEGFRLPRVDLSISLKFDLKKS